MDSKTKFEKDSPETKEQANALLVDYYKEQRAAGDKIPDRPALLSWTLREDGVMVIVDGASGRKLEFVTDQEARDKEAAEEKFEIAQLAELDAEAKAINAENAAEQAKAEAKRAAEAAKEAAKANALKTNEQAKAEAKKKAEAARK